jgi:tRNA A-37 threonylcarbamoyl transferase component Bud32
MLAPGSTFGRYRIVRALGAGGMGQVYEARDTTLRRDVALKVVRDERADASAVSEEARARLLREARAAAALHHPNAIAVYDVGEHDGVAFIAMELARGQTLRARLHGGASLGERVAWLEGVARALGAAHDEGIVHRDVKPDNVMVCEDGSVKVLDFGIARIAREGDAPREGDDAPASFRTAEGVVTGTPRYMAPEQLEGAPLDGRADQFAWGVLAYELLARVHPQTTTGTAERWGAPPKELAAIDPAVPGAVSDVVMRALERDPAHRHPSMRAVADALAPFAVSRAPDASGGAAGEATPAATMRLDAATGPMEAGAPIADPTAPQPLSVVPRRVEASVLDATRPTWRRLALPGAGLGLILLGIATMAVLGLAGDGAATPELGRWLVRVGWMTCFVAPLTLLARGSRPARLDALPQRLEIGAARGMSQALAPTDVAAASLAPLGGRFSVLVLPRRTAATPIVLEVAAEGDARAILESIGARRARVGVMRWPLARGPFDYVCLSSSVAWRVAIPLTQSGSGVLAGVTFAAGLVFGLLSAALALAPRPGPHLELGDDDVHAPGRSIPLREVERAAATTEAIELTLVSGEIVRVPAPLARLSRRGLCATERAHLAAHVTAAAARARAAHL